MEAVLVTKELGMSTTQYLEPVEGFIILRIGLQHASRAI